jgi:thiamine transport system substrate-binding protein
MLPFSRSMTISLVATVTALAAAVGAAQLSRAQPAGGVQPILRILAHDYYSATAEVLGTFERQHGVKVEILGYGDANEVVDKAVRTPGRPDADLIFGFDNLMWRRLADVGALSPYVAKRRASIPADIRAQFDDAPLVTPIDYGFVTINWDKRAGGTPPSTFEELTRPQWKDKLVVEDPALSSPGLQFLLTTISHFGERGDYTWKEYWRDLNANGVLVARDWGEAYTKNFSARGGSRPLVVSYTTSPAAEVRRAKGALSEPPIANVIPGPLFRQVEAVAVLRGAKNEELARAFIDHMLTDAYQAQIPAEDSVYPVIPGLPAPDWWRWAEVDVKIAQVSASQADIDRWISEWQAVMAK